MIDCGAGREVEEGLTVMHHDKWPALTLGILMIAAFVAGMAFLAGGKQGVKDLFRAIGWMWLLIIGGALAVVLLLSLR
ncbi:hypothetical protein LB553_05515 [Mesorhizobium sp. CA8]|uniref:hypothetical protein n=1 Tax=Mesorhizobium sp. CA8 TaxID=2876637 RepID=UPI001CC93FE6|nr:hypothetical protein [Mesorhizobium sp. CA8]MBZ9760333.1 hypothetical protein [Mesorhizobium sp. CA8]